MDDGFFKVFKYGHSAYVLSEAGYWYKYGKKPVCVAGLLDSRSDEDTIKLIKLMDNAEFFVNISDDEFRELFESPGTLKEKSARLYQQIKGREQLV